MSRLYHVDKALVKTEKELLDQNSLFLRRELGQKVCLTSHTWMSLETEGSHTVGDIELYL